jgi:UDP-2-acetamido-3-amino-2,3-dideoxy-glucuronate N-acetyltransferase
MATASNLIHPSSIVESGAAIGEGTRVWHFCHIRGSAVIGKFCNLGQNIYIDQHVSIGDGVKIQNNVSVYQGVRLEDHVFIGPSVVFTNVLNPRSFVSRKNEFRETLVGKGASIGANATILAGVKVGEYAMVGAGSVVTRDIPPYAKVAGNPAKQMGWITRTGEPLSFTDSKSFFCASEQAFYHLTETGVVFTL